jgi:hypothetical protein
MMILVLTLFYICYFYMPLAACFLLLASLRLKACKIKGRGSAPVINAATAPPQAESLQDQRQGQRPCTKCRHRTSSG